jgi:hypothetical protein
MGGRMGVKGAARSPPRAGGASKCSKAAHTPLHSVNLLSRQPPLLAAALRPPPVALHSCITYLHSNALIDGRDRASHRQDARQRPE